MGLELGSGHGPVAGNAKDEIGDRMAALRESELLCGPDSLLGLYGPLLVRISGRPNLFANTTRAGVRPLVSLAEFPSLNLIITSSWALKALACILKSAKTVLELGCPIRGILSFTSTST